MPMYSYKGFHSTSGARKKGRIEADSERSARQKLKKNMQIIVADIKEEASTAQACSHSAVEWSCHQTRVATLYQHLPWFPRCSPHFRGPTTS